MRENRLRSLLRDGKPSIGTHIHITNPRVIEAIGFAGIIDYVEFTAEYAPYDLYDLENMARATEVVGLSSMIKVDQEPRTYLAQRGLGAGFQNVLFADVRSVEDAQACVRAVRAETPTTKGVHGFSQRRNVGYFMESGSAEWIASMNEAIVAIMIEKRESIEDLEAILSVEGIDMVQFGPGDYSLSVGEVWKRRVSPEVLAVQKDVYRTAMRMGVTPRVELRDLDDTSVLEEWLDFGIRHFCIGTDLVILHNWMRTNGGKLKKLIVST